MYLKIVNTKLKKERDWRYQIKVRWVALMWDDQKQIKMLKLNEAVMEAITNNPILLKEDQQNIEYFNNNQQKDV